MKCFIQVQENGHLHTSSDNQILYLQASDGDQTNTVIDSSGLQHIITAIQSSEEVSADSLRTADGTYQIGVDSGEGNVKYVASGEAHESYVSTGEVDVNYVDSGNANEMFVDSVDAGQVYIDSAETIPSYETVNSNTNESTNASTNVVTNASTNVTNEGTNEVMVYEGGGETIRVCNGDNQVYMNLQQLAESGIQIEDQSAGITIGQQFVEGNSQAP